MGLTSCATTLIRMTLSRLIDLLFFLTVFYCPVECHSAERHSSDCHGAFPHARWQNPGNTKGGGSITVLLTSYLTGLESAVWQLTFCCKTDKSKPVKQEVNGTVILPPLVFPAKSLADISWCVLNNLDFCGKKMLVDLHNKLCHGGS